MGEETERWLRDTDGFEGFLLLATGGQGGRFGVLGEREVAERHNHARSQFRERMLSIAGVQIEEVVDYDVAFARFGPGLLSAAGR